MQKVNLKILAAVCVFIMTLTGPVSARIIYVDPNGSADFNDIQAAISDPCTINGDEIEVAPGTYNEAIDFNDKEVRLYSSGGPDVTTIDANGIDGAYHVVQCVSDKAPVLEGFTITGGNANGLVYPDDCGGGMYNKYSSPTVTNCIFTGNAAIYGGGGMYNEGGQPTVTNCVFIGNTTTGAGGGMGNKYDSYESNPSVTDCNFINNTANQGGGMYNYESDPSVNNCTFNGNSASTDGGGMYNNNCSPTVENCRFIANTAGYSGGMFNSNSSPTVTNCTFSGNLANWGGGMYNYQSSPRMINCTFSGNSATNAGGGILNQFDSSPIVTNCIFWGDTPIEIADWETSTTTVTYSDVDGGWPGTGNIDADPCFVDANHPDPNLWSLRLKPDSPCIDAGDSTILLNERIYLDLNGKHRYVDIDSVDDTGYGPLEFLDIGAYEFNCSGIAGDNNCDGVVDFKDLAILAGNWLAGTEPEL